MTQALRAAASPAGRLVVLAALAVGCGDRRTAHFAPVDGLVTHRGQPLAHGTVIFVPEPPHRAALAYGDLDGAGCYTLATNKKYPGVAPGPYRVCVVSVGEPQPERKPMPPGMDDPLLRKPSSLIPERYGGDASTPLRFEVQPGRNVCDIVLE